jgi:hypothetical protein
VGRAGTSTPTPSFGWVLRTRGFAQSPAAIALAALCTVFATLGVARAQEAGVPKASRPLHNGRGVDVTIVAGSEDAQPLVEAIREVVGRLGLPVSAHVVQEAPPETGEGVPTQGLARAAIDLTSPGGVQVAVYGKNGQLALLRLFARNASASVLREEIADAVRSAVEAQLLIDPERRNAASAPTQGPTATGGASTGPTAGLAPSIAEPPVAEARVAEPPVAEPRAAKARVAEPPSPPPAAPVGPPRGEAPAPATTPDQGLALDLTALGGIGGFAWTTAAVVSHVGGQAAWTYRKWLNPSLTVSGEYLLPFEAKTSDVTATASVVSLRIVPAVEVFHARSVAVDLGVGAGIDVISVQPPSKHPPNIGATAGTRTDPVLRGAVTAYAGLAPRIVLSLTIAYDFDVAAPHPRFVFADEASPVLAPWRARPLALVGLTFAALGEARFASGFFR